MIAVDDRSPMTAGQGGVFASEEGPPHLEVSIRLEAAGDEAGVRAVELAAFSGPEEAEIVDRIREDAPEGWRSLVAADGRGRIVGHLLMTPCPVEDEDGRLLGTVLAIGPGGRRSRGPGAGRRLGADGRGDEPRGRSCGAGARAARPPVLLPAVRLRAGARRRASSRPRRPGRTPPGWPACSPPGPTTCAGPSAITRRSSRSPDACSAVTAGCGWVASGATSTAVSARRPTPGS